MFKCNTACATSCGVSLIQSGTFKHSLSDFMILYSFLLSMLSHQIKITDFKNYQYLIKIFIHSKNFVSNISKNTAIVTVFYAV